jgi:outer membrane receptor protein involved in Fe transport
LQVIGKRAQIQNSAQPGFLGLEFAPSNPRAADWSDRRLDPGLGVVDPVSGATTPGTAQMNDFDPYSDRKMWQASLRGDIDLSDDITLTSLTSYTHFKQRQGVDGDGSYLVLTDLVDGRGYIKSFNQELRIANAASNPIRWIVGANYEDSRTLEDENLRYFDNSNYNADNLFINASGVISRQKIRNIAVFGNIEFEVSEALTLKAGARYTDSKNKNYNCGYTSETGNVDKLFNVLGTALGTVPFTPIGPSDCYTLNDQGVPGEAFRKTLKENNVSWRVGIDYKISNRTLVYANASRGYKAGSFPEISAANYTGLQPVVQESVTAFEGGIKTQALDGVIDLNAAAFYYDYKDKQIRGKLLDPVFGVLDALVNVPKSRIMGAEADITLRPVHGLTINGAVTFLDSKVKNYQGFDLLGFTNDFRGDDLPFTPRWSGVVNVDYRTPVHSGGSLFAGFSVNARSGSDATLGGGRIAFPSPAIEPATAVKDGVAYPYSMKGYTTVDARLGFEAEDRSWKVMVWGKNIFNEYYWTNVIAGNDTAARFAGRPATYGITFGFKVR